MTVYNQEISLQTSITPRFDMETRANINHEGDGKGIFTNGDKIAVYITPEGGQPIRRTATLNGTTWTFDDGKINWGDLKASKAVFSAYHPVIDTPVGGKFTLKCETAQNFTNKLENSDKQLHSTITGTAGNPVQLKFHHAMHYLEVYLASNDKNVSSNDLKMAEIHVNAFTEVYLDPATGTFTPKPGTEGQIRMRNNTTEKFRAVICPQPIQEKWRTNGWLTLKIKSQNKNYNAPLASNDGTEFNYLESGKKFQLNLLVGKKNEVIEDLTNKTIWVAGLKNIPSQTTWGYAYANMQSLGLKYEPYYGWYDIKKLDATGPQFDDHRLCWAATTSNILHWWYDRNKENIECYFKYKQATDPNYIAPKYNYNNKTHKESGIFDFFKRTCLDRGGYVNQGIKWYLRGDWISNQGDATSTENNKESLAHQAQKGFFGEVYTEVPTTDIIKSNGSSYEMGKFIKEALQRGDALGIDHQSFDGGHAITIWGAAFDDQGEITTLYVCDNNHSDAELNQGGGVMVPGKEGPYGIFQMRVKRDAPNASTFSLQSSSDGKYSIYIYNVHAVSQGKKTWDAFWAKHPEYAPKK